MESTVCVDITQGGLRGRKVVSKRGTVYYSFQGIPYAKPPVGRLRFQPPQEAEAWEGIREALIEGSKAPQFDELEGNKFVGEEDCLYLNVYTPWIPKKHEKLNIPVMVWIHGGGFYEGSGNTQFYGPDYLIERNIVLVTINYRLGALGFLSTGDAVVPGNNGLKDQVMALKWIHKEIRHFGGNKNNVTIFGESSGSGSVHLQMLSPRPKGLFHKAIAQSGSALNPWAYNDPTVAREKAFRLGRAMGCNTNNSIELLEFLMTASAQEIVEGTLISIPEEEKHPLPLCFTSTKETKSEDSFLPDSPEHLISQGCFYQIPFMIGVTSNEGMFVTADIVANPSYYESFKLPVPNDFNVSVMGRKYNEVVRRIQEFYLPSKKISTQTMQNYIDIYSDLWLNYGVIRTVKEHSSRSSEPIFFYQFSYDGKLGYAGNGFIPDRLPGACHGDELGYLFSMCFNEDKELEPEDDNYIMIRRMVTMWTNFATTGNPTPKADSLLGVIWKPASKSDLNFLDIDKKMTMQKDFLTDRIIFWDLLYEYLYQN